MALRDLLHRRLFPDCDATQQWEFELVAELQRENAGLRTQLANQWWCPPPAPGRDDDEVVYHGWYHPEKRDPHDNNHTVVVRYGGGMQQLLEALPSEYWDVHPEDEFEWGCSSAGSCALAISLMVDALGGRFDPRTKALWAMGESALVQPFIETYIRGFGDEWELTRSELQRWADRFMQDAASRDGS